MTQFFSDNGATYGAAIGNAGGTVTLAGATFSRNAAAGDETYGGAIYNNGIVTISGDATFADNSAKYGAAIDNDGGTVTLAGATFSRNAATGNSYGGAIDNYNNGTVTISGDATFSENSATYGGGIYNEGGTISFSGDSLSFTGNTAASYGGAIKNKGNISFSGNAIFTDNNATYGAAIDNDGGTVTLAGATFSRNAATGNSYGGAIENYNNGIVTISGNATFSENSAIYGGAVYNSAVISFSGSSVSFSGNTASYGGVIYNDGGTVNFAGSSVSFSGNTADVGGAIYNNGGTVSFTGDSVSFSGNTAAGSGGAIYNKGNISFAGDAIFTDNSAKYGAAIDNDGGTVTLAGATFSRNAATGNSYGGAIDNYSNGTVTISGDAEFSENSAKNGGAVYNEDSVNFTGSNVSFSGNSATYGGAIYNNGGTSAATINFSGDSVSFTGNTAANGGAVYNEGGTSAATINFSGASVSFTGNTAVGYGGAIYNKGNISFAGDAIFTDNGATYGAAIGNSGGTVTLAGATFSRNAATGNSYGGGIYNYNNGIVTISGDAEFSENSAKYGGAIDNDGGTVTLAGATFSRNAATGNSSGGAIDNYNNGIVTISGDAEFTENSAIYGGAVYNSAVISFTGSSVSFSGNTAAGYGGAIYNKGNISFSGDAIFTDNGATYGGTAIDNAGGTVTLAGATFSRNAATGYSSGGAIDNYSNGIVTISGDAEFSENSAKYGGAVYNSAVISFSGSSVSFSGNTAQYGGAIYNYGGTVSFSGDSVSFTGNTGIGVGAIYNIGGTVSFTGDSVSFTGNTATGAESYGGAICNYYNNASLTISGDAEFTENSATYGGAVSNGSVISFTGSSVSFSGNTAQYGGAICNEVGTVNFAGSSVSFSGNTAYLGGAIYNDGGTINLDGTVELKTASDDWVNQGYYEAAGGGSPETKTAAVVNWNLSGVTEPAQSTVCVKGFEYYKNLTTTTGEGEELLVKQVFTVSATQAKGDYTIATGSLGNLAENVKTFTIKTADDQTGKTITAGGPSVEYGDLIYTLLLQNNNALVLTAAVSIADAVITVTGEYIYNGEAQEAAVTVKMGDTTLVKDVDYTLSYTDNVNAGTATVTVTGINSYAGTAETGFTIQQKGLTVNGTTVAEKMYDGTTDATIGTLGSLDGKIDGDDVSIDTASGTFTDKNAGDSKDVTISYTLKGDKASNYTVADGTTTAEITRRNVTLTSATDSKPYDGTPLTNKNVEESGSGFVEGEGATYDVTGTQTDIGSSANTFTYNLNNGTLANNYEINMFEGTLTVIPPLGVAVDNAMIGKWFKNGDTIMVTGTYTGNDPITSFKFGENDITEYDPTGKTWSYTFDSHEETTGTLYTITITTDTATASTQYTLKVDTFAPEITFSGDDPQYATSEGIHWYKQTTESASVTATGSDETSGVKCIKVDGVESAGESKAVTLDLSAEMDNAKTYTFNAVDNAGNEGENRTFTYNVDGTGPTITNAAVSNSIEKAGCHWVKQNAVSSVSANVNDTKSGVKEVTFGGETVTGTEGAYSKSYDTSAEHGPTEYKIAATDNVGNGNDQTLMIGVDGTGPTMKLKNTVTETVYKGSVSGAPDSASASTTNAVESGKDMSGSYTSSWFSSVDPAFTITIADQLLSKVTVNGAEQSFTGTSFDYTFSNLEQGENTFTIVAEDQVGNKTESTITLKYDNENPVFAANSITVEGVEYAGLDLASAKDSPVIVSDITSFNVTLNATDTSNLTSNYCYSADGSSWTEWTTFSESNPITSGEGYYRFAAVDAAGNSTIAGKYFYVGRPVKYTLSDSVSVTYDGEEHGISVTVTDPVEGAAVYYSLDGGENWTLTENGSYMLTDATLAGTVSVCFKLTAAGYCDTITEARTITINRKWLSICGSSADDKMYDGTVDATVHPGTLIGVIEGDVVTLSAEGHFDAAGTGPHKTVTALYTLEGQDAANYRIIVAESLDADIIARKVYLESGSAAKVYDGTPLTSGIITETGDGFIEGEGAIYDVTGSQTNVGSSKNTFSYKLDDNTRAVNYNIVKQYGTLTVSDPAVLLTVTGNFSALGGAFQLMVNGTALSRTAEERTYLAGKLENVSNWEIIGSGDFSGSGSDGLLWRDLTTGELVMQYDMTNFDEVNQKTHVLGSVWEGFTAKAAGVFTDNGLAGALIQCPETGDISVSTTRGLACFAREDNGETFTGWLGALVNTWEEGVALKGDLSDPASINANNYRYEVVGVGDFNGDGRDDVMLKNTMPEVVTQDGVDYTITGSGDVFTFLTGDNEAIRRGEDPAVSYAGRVIGDWNVIGTGDFDGDGIDDVLLSDGSDLAAWKMADGQRQSDFVFSSLAEGDELAGIADVNNDGTDDILIRTVSTEQLTAWTIEDGKVTGTLALK